MAASYAEIKNWFERGASEPDKTHMIVVCDTYDHDDYPVYVSKTQKVCDVETEYNGKSMQKVMEVYNLKEEMLEQLSRPRCFNY